MRPRHKIPNQELQAQVCCGSLKRFSCARASSMLAVPVRTPDSSGATPVTPPAVVSDQDRKDLEAAESRRIKKRLPRRRNRRNIKNTSLLRADKFHSAEVTTFVSANGRYAEEHRAETLRQRGTVVRPLLFES